MLGSGRSALNAVGLGASIALALAGCGGGGGGDSSPAVSATPTAVISAVAVPTADATTAAVSAGGESCSICHSESSTTPVARNGVGHQDDYKQLYQNGVIKVTNLSVAISATAVANDTATLTFQMKKSGAAYDCKQAGASAGYYTFGSYWVKYDSTATDPGKRFPDDVSLASYTVGTALDPIPLGAGKASGSTLNYNSGTNVCTFTKQFANTTANAANIAELAKIAANTDGVLTVYGADGILERNPAGTHLLKNKNPFGAILRTGAIMGVATAPFTSLANVSGCENCHTVPFNKHAYIPGKVDDLTGDPTGAAGKTQDFYLCKGCHYDLRTGSDTFWQLLGEAKLADATTAAGKALRKHTAAVDAATEAMTAAESTKYAYKARLMNDTHMSHAMEFAYPQSMRNCVTCHAGKMDATTGIFQNSFFKAVTCISCHTADGIVAKMKAAKYPHDAYVADTPTLQATDCTICHTGTALAAPSFSKIHTGGYDPKIYSSTGVRYSDTFKVTVDSATIDSNNVLDVKFSATGTLGSDKASAIVPTVMVGLYGYNTKDFLVGAHSTNADGKKNLEHLWGDGNARFTDVSAASGAWEVKVDLSLWKDIIGKTGTVKRAEIAILPKLTLSGTTVIAGLNAPSRTFDLVNNKFIDTYYTDIVNVKTVGQGSGTAVKGCNTCHDQLGSSFHDGIRGGNIRVCRLCHVKSSAGSHLELQSRSIDSYVHSLHTFQYLDKSNVDFSDTFAAMEYKHHTESNFPRFGLANGGSGGATDCESCHVTGTYGVPDASKSLPALLSATSTLKPAGTANPIGTYPSYVTGPGANACGGCHRAQKIVEEDAGGLTSLWNHWQQNGYLITSVTTLWDAVVAKVMAPFK